MEATTSVERGCGKSRTEGGIYLEMRLSDTGSPLEHFLADPIMPLSREVVETIPRLGMTLHEEPGGAVHVIDWVGSEHYPHAADFLEEVRAKGLSRKISPHLAIDRLDPQRSRIFVIHAKGYAEAWKGMHQLTAYGNEPRSAWDMLSRERCGVSSASPRLGRLHFDPEYEHHCSRLLWFAAPPNQLGLYRGEEIGHRAFTDLSYPVLGTVEAAQSAFAPAIIASLPITNLAVVRARDGGHVKKLIDATERSRYPVMEVDA